MANLTKNDVLKLARLSRLNLTEDETKEFHEEINEILNYVSMLQDADVKGLKPTYQVTGLTNVSREDVEKNYGASQLDLLKNVPKTEKSYIKVNRMIG